MMAALRVPEHPEQLMAPRSAFDNKMGLSLNEQGMIFDCNVPSGGLFGYRRSGGLFGYRRSELAWRHISELMPELAGIKLMRDDQVNPRLRFLSHIGHRFQLLGLGGKPFEVRFFILDMENQGRRYLRAMIFPFDVELDVAGISR